VSGVIDRILAHYAAQPVRRIEVPEWGEGDEPLEIYVRPWTIEQMSRVVTPGAPSDLAANVNAIIEKAEDAEGKKIFGKEHKIKLLKFADANVINRVAAELFAEGVEGNG